MLGHSLREYTDKYLVTFGNIMAKTHVNPNLFSAIAILLAAVAAYYIQEQSQWLALIFVLLATGWDGIDGAVAKAQGKVSKTGYFIEGIIDKWVEVVIMFGFFLAGYQIESYLLMTTSLMQSFVKPKASMAVQIGEHDWPAIGERLERMAVLVFSMFLSIYLPTFTLNGSTYDTQSVFLYIIFVMVFIGGIQRIQYGVKLIEAGGSENLNIKSRKVLENVK